MVNNMPERLIKFPISEWMVQSGRFKTDLPSVAYCICYQYNIDSNGYGPYGFLTERSDRLLSILFTNLMFFSKEGKTLDACSTLSKNGVYFYGNNNDRMNKQLVEYRKVLLKNKLRTNKGLLEETCPEKPILLNLYNDYGGIEVSVINSLIEEGYHFLFDCFFTPVAGKSIIVFDCNIWDRAIEYCKNNGIDFQEVDSVDNLKEW
ncbi:MULTISPECIES: hypothetical protein [Citrobacter]|uniref:Uncharacterized protein n=3 Tax=Enterobacteriaceae TaxID=543 RepID=A0A3S4KKQ0_CITKO|nr:MULTISPECIES: hypothetical protein [Citrobacter]MBJ9106525.1 hypothetical protein [Citrobacter koseri]MBJ9122338.1 hypothetical protein [Citrobacter koseri]MBJ9140545.1 hypothetical protein [Citrobacter koseri]MDM2948209.1 hypothetical protein [Citrobacter sp. CK207]MDM2962653.1 hypothetical protein [Citrobacter sp. CK202]